LNGIPKKESRDIASRNDSICAGTINWRSKPLRRYRTIVQLIAATTTDTGLKVRAELDENKYPKGVKVSDLQMAAVNLTRHSFHGDWNYTVSPQRKTPRRTRID
jgi:hypothetical protein